MVFIFRALEYYCMNHEDQRLFFNLKSSYIDFPPSFEYLCYRSTVIIKRPRLILVPSLRGSSEVDLSAVMVNLGDSVARGVALAEI